MRSWINVFLFFCLGSLGAAAHGAMEKRTFRNGAGSRNYYLYVPAALRHVAARPLFVMLHGCTQNAQDFASGTGMNALADKFGFDVIYPEQTRENNDWSCWNWFQPENLRRGGELSILADMTKAVATELGTDRRLIFVAGLSAGGAMASNLVACYSDVFAGAAIHSGLAFDAAEDQNEATSVMRQGPRRPAEQTATSAYVCSPTRLTPLRVLIFQGDRDYTVNAKNAEAIDEQFMALNDLLDNGKPDHSLPVKITKGEYQTKTPLKATFTEARFANTLTLLRRITILGMGHAWSGGKQGMPYMESRGPSASDAIVSYFLTEPASVPPFRR